MHHTWVHQALSERFLYNMGQRHYIGREGRALLIVQELYKQSMYGLPGLTAHTIAVHLGWKPGRFIRDVCAWGFEAGLLKRTEEKHTGQRVKYLYDVYPIDYYNEQFPVVGRTLMRRFGRQINMFKELGCE